MNCGKPRVVRDRPGPMRRMALIAVFGLAAALTALPAVASASGPLTFYAGEGASSLNGINSVNHMMSFDGGDLECRISALDGEATEAAESITVEPTISECASPFGSTTVDTNGCDLRFHAEEVEIVPGYSVMEGTMDIVGCDITTDPFTGEEVEAGIEISGFCDWTIPSQTGLGTVEYDNVGSGNEREVGMTASIDSIEYTQGGWCTPKTATNGQWYVEWGVQAANEEEESVGLWLE